MHHVRAQPDVPGSQFKSGLVVVRERAINLLISHHRLTCVSFGIEKSPNRSSIMGVVDVGKSWSLVELVGSAVAQSVECATPVEEVVDSIPAVPPAPHWLGRCQYNVSGCDRSHGLPALSRQMFAI